MQHIHFFQYNIPAENEPYGRTNKFINVLAEWNSDAFYSDGKPMCYVNPVNMTFYDAMLIKDWTLAYSDIKKLAENHFADLAKQERINQARAILAVEENPVLNRYEENNTLTTTN